MGEASIHTNTLGIEDPIRGRRGSYMGDASIQTNTLGIEDPIHGDYVFNWSQADQTPSNAAS